MKVYFNQFNTSTDRNLLPLAAGLITSYAKRELPNVEFEIKILRERPDKTASEYENPDVLAFSCYIWNLRHSLEVARLAKLRFPKSLVIVGGPSIPRKPETLKRFFAKHPFVDICVHGEGEETFTDILKCEGDYSKVKGISYRSGDSYIKTEGRERIKDLDSLPSPYLDGTFDILIKRHKELITGTIWETNRGCPFSCAFCLSEGTFIRTKNGEKKIENVGVDDAVLGWNDVLKEPVFNKIIDIVSRGIKPILKISAGPLYVKSTHEHRFLTKYGWREAKDIKQGEEILGLPMGSAFDPQWVRIDSIESAGEKLVYDLVGANPWPNFFANGFLAHNCDWGQATQSKVNIYGLDRLRAEIDWIARNNIFYVYAADANFGIKKRDIEIARYMGDKKKSVGSPGFFMINWMKNSHVRTIEIADILREAGIGCQVTLSMQSFDEVTLEAIKRSNIDLDTFRSLKAEYNKRGIATYSELLLGLPGETYSSFCAGVTRALSPFPKDHFNIYLCRTLENAEMSEPDYRERYGIETRWCEVAMARRTNDNVTVNEEEEIIVGTKSMPIEDWKKSFLFGYMTNCLANLRLGHVIINHLRLELGLSVRAYIEYLIENGDGPIRLMVETLRGFQDSILASKSSVMQVPGFGPRYWEPHEAAYLVASREPLSFHAELEALTSAFTGLSMQGVFATQQSESPILGGVGTEQTSYLKAA